MFERNIFRILLSLRHQHLIIYDNCLIFKLGKSNNKQSGMSDELGKSFQQSMNQKFGRGTYQVLQPIKRGADGYVYKIQYIREKRLGALKVLPRFNVILDHDLSSQQHKKQKPDTLLQSKALNQIKIHESIRSNYVVKLHNSFKDETNYFMFLEYVAKGDLADQISRHPGGLAIDRIRKIGLQLAKGIDTIHRKFIVHRDIKPLNILITQDDEIKICDFSCAKIVNGDKTDRRNVVGTLQYMAPQSLGKHQFSVDVWSFGIVLFVMATGHTPFKIQKPQLSEYLAKINKASIAELSASLDKYICTKNQKKQVKKSEFCKCKDTNHQQCYRKLIDLLRKILVLNVDSRIKITEVISHCFFTGEELPKQEIESQQTDRIGHDNIMTTNPNMRPKTSYSLENIKRSLNYMQDTGNKFTKTTQDILDRHRDKCYPNNSHAAIINRKDEGVGNVKPMGKQDKIKINSKLRQNNQNINTLNMNGDKKYTTDADDLIHQKLSSNYTTQQSKDNKYISDGNPTHNANSPKQEPLNCIGLSCCKSLPSQKLTINQDGLKAQFHNSDKSLMISPRGRHITLTYEGKSKYYDLDRLPQKYMGHYNYYRIVVDSLRSEAVFKERKKKSQCQLETEGQRRSQKTSRDKQEKQNRTDRPNSTNKLQKQSKEKSSALFSSTMEMQIKSQVDINLTLNLPKNSRITEHSFFSSISVLMSTKNTKQLEIELLKTDKTSRKIKQKLDLVQFGPSQSKLEYLLMKLVVKIQYEDDSIGRDAEELMNKVEKMNQTIISKWAQNVYKFCSWVALMPNYTQTIPQEKLKIQSKQGARVSKQSPKPMQRGYLGQKEKLYNMSNPDNQTKQYNHRILLDNFVSKYR